MANPLPNTGYNGWANYSTWAVNLWLGNVEKDYRYWTDVVNMTLKFHGGDREKTIAAVATKMKESVHENAPKLPGMYQDLLNSSLAEVDWYEIAAAFVEPF